MIFSKFRMKLENFKFLELNEPKLGDSVNLPRMTILNKL